MRELKGCKVESGICGSASSPTQPSASHQAGNHATAMLLWQAAHINEQWLQNNPATDPTRL
jgi:hypothetical protein